MNQPMHPHQGAPGAWGAPPGPSAPRIPPPPAGGGKRRRQADARLLVWLGAFVLGAALGFVFYRYIQGVDSVFDFLLAAVA